MKQVYWNEVLVYLIPGWETRVHTTLDECFSTICTSSVDIYPGYNSPPICVPVCFWKNLSPKTFRGKNPCSIIGCHATKANIKKREKDKVKWAPNTPHILCFWFFHNFHNLQGCHGDAHSYSSSSKSYRYYQCQYMYITTKNIWGNNAPHWFLDAFEELAHSSLIIVSYNKKSGLGLERGLSPTFDLLVDRYIETGDLENPNMSLVYVKEGKISL